MPFPESLLEAYGVVVEVILEGFVTWGGDVDVVILEGGRRVRFNPPPHRITIIIRQIR